MAFLAWDRPDGTVAAGGSGRVERTHVRHNLPLQRTSLIGREQDVVAVRDLLLGAGGRLVTLTGPGGAGKSRLALQVAEEVVGVVADGVRLVELASLPDPSLVPQAVALALGLREQSANRITDALVAKLSSSQLLLVLDNCERLVSACAQLADAMLAGCPDLRILATSREPLQVLGEITWRVPPLAVPDQQQASRTDDLASAPAVRLFLERAQAVQPDFRLTPQNAQAIANICRRLEGLPLGIELAAARLRALGVEEILERLNASFKVLVGRGGIGPERHLTMQATLDWSSALLSVTELAMFRRLAVFAGGWTLEAAEAVCAGDHVGQAEIVDVLTRLVDKCLVVMEDRGGRARYRLLESVREYADDQLRASGELEVTRARHADYFLGLADEIAGWTRRYDVIEVGAQEQDNLRAALRWCVDRPAPDIGLRLARGCMVFWNARGTSHEGRMWLTRLLALPGAEPPTVGRAAALGCSGLFALRHGDLTQARALHEQALATAREVGDAHQLFSNLVDSACGARLRGEYALAREHLEEALAVARGASNAFTETFGLFLLGRLAALQADYPTADSRGEECLRLARRIGDLWLTSSALSVLGFAALGQDDVVTSRRRFEESLPIQRQVGDRWFMSDTLYGFARLELAQQRLADARALFAESLTLRHEESDVALIAEGIEGIAALDAACGHSERALRLAGFADATRTSIGAALHPEDRLLRDRWLDPLCGVVDGETVARAKASGERLSIDEAVALALESAENERTAESDSGSDSRTSAVLSPREQQVAGLLAQGLSNHQIAERLVITDRTVAAHVEHILDKLGFRSRTQVALWAAEQGIPVRVGPHR